MVVTISTLVKHRPSPDMHRLVKSLVSSLPDGLVCYAVHKRLRIRCLFVYSSKCHTCCRAFTNRPESSMSSSDVSCALSIEMPIVVDIIPVVWTGTIIVHCTRVFPCFPSHMIMTMLWTASTTAESKVSASCSVHILIDCQRMIVAALSVLGLWTLPCRLAHAMHCL